MPADEARKPPSIPPGLRPVARARELARLLDEGWGRPELAEALGITLSVLDHETGLVRLPADVAERVDAGELGRSAAYEISKLFHVEDQRTIADRVIAEGLNVTQTVAAVRELLPRRGAKKRRPPADKTARPPMPKASNRIKLSLLLDLTILSIDVSLGRVWAYEELLGRPPVCGDPLVGSVVILDAEGRWHLDFDGLTYQGEPTELEHRLGRARCMIPPELHAAARAVAPESRVPRGSLREESPIRVETVSDGARVVRAANQTLRGGSDLTPRLIRVLDVVARRYPDGLRMAELAVMSGVGGARDAFRDLRKIPPLGRLLAKPDRPSGLGYRARWPDAS